MIGKMHQVKNSPHAIQNALCCVNDKIGSHTHCWTISWSKRYIIPKKEDKKTEKDKFKLTNMPFHSCWISTRLILLELTFQTDHAPVTQPIILMNFFLRL